MIRALVVGNEERVRYSLEETLRRVANVAVTAASGKEALDLRPDMPFHMAVVGLNLGATVMAYVRGEEGITHTSTR